MEVSKDKDRFKSILVGAMTSELKSQQPLAQPMATSGTAPTTSTSPPKPKVSRKRKAEGPVAREFTEADIPDFIDALIEDHIIFVPDNNMEFVDMTMIRGRFEKVLADRYQITRGSKTIISRLLKPKQINVLLTEKMEAKEAAFINTLKTKPNDLMWASYVGDEYAMDEYFTEKKEVIFKNVFLNAKFTDNGPRAIPCKPRVKKSQKATEQAPEPSVAEQEASTIFATPLKDVSADDLDISEDDEE